MSSNDIFTNVIYVIKFKIIVYSLLVFFSTFIFIGTAVMEDNADGCPLYVDSNISRESVSDDNCNFPLVVAIMFQLIYLLLVRLPTLTLIIVGKLDTQTGFFSNILELTYVMVDLLVFLLTLSSACILSVGTNITCDTLDDCDDYEWYNASQVAQAGAWISVLLWLLVCVGGFLFLCRSGRMPLPDCARAGNSGNTHQHGQTQQSGQTEAHQMQNNPSFPATDARY